MATIENNTESWKGHTFPEVEAHLKLCGLYEMLAKAPEIIKRGDEYEINHPLVNYPGAECILVVYRKSNGKCRKKGSSYREKFGSTGEKKKGFCVYNNPSWVSVSGNPYFDFLKFNTLPNLRTFFNGLNKYSSTCGIVLRIPNPEYSGPTTLDRNATYKGVKEMLWSDIKKIKVSRNGGLTGIGLTF